MKNITKEKINNFECIKFKTYWQWKNNILDWGKCLYQVWLRVKVCNYLKSSVKLNEEKSIKIQYVIGQKILADDNRLSNKNGSSKMHFKSTLSYVIMSLIYGEILESNTKWYA